MHRFPLALLAGFVLVLALAACQGSALPLFAPPSPTPTATATSTPTATPTPLPTSTPTPTPTPKPKWRKVQRWQPPQGRVFTNGYLSPDGTLLLLVSQPPASDLGWRPEDSDPWLHLYHIEASLPMWEGRIPSQTRLAWIDDAFWLPGNRVLGITGINAYQEALVLWDRTNGQVVWERQLYHNEPGLRVAAFDARRQRVVVRQGDQTFLTAYTWPGMNAAERYTVAQAKQGCCIVTNLDVTDYGLAGVGWERYGKRYNLIFWEDGQTEGRYLRLPYSFPDVSVDHFTWGPRHQVAFVIVPAVASSVDVYTFNVIDTRTGNVVWTLTERDYPVFYVDWLPGRGWMLATLSGEVRVYTEANRFDIIRRMDAGFLGTLRDIDVAPDGTQWLAVFETQAELWVWR